MKSQRDIVMDYLKTHGSITSYEAFEHFGITKLPARICELRKAGVIIPDRIEHGKNRFGVPVSYKRYLYQEQG